MRLVANKLSCNLFTHTKGLSCSICDKPIQLHDDYTLLEYSLNKIILICEVCENDKSIDITV